MADMLAVKIKEFVMYKLEQGTGLFACVLYKISDGVIQEEQRKLFS